MINPDKLRKFILDAVQRTKGRDEIVITEVVADRVELYLRMETEEEGIGTVASAPPPPPPSAMLRANLPIMPEPDPDKNAEPPRVLVMPGDREFNESLDGKKVQGFRLSKVGPPKTMTAPKIRKYWDEGTLISTIEQNTPEEIEFTPEDCDPDKVRIVCKRNIQNIPGVNEISTIRLEYVNDALIEGQGGVVMPGGQGVPDTPVSIGVTAFTTFCTHDKDQDFEAAINGPKGIVAQLKRNFRRGALGLGRLDPQSGPEPPPLDQSALRFEVGSISAPPMSASESATVQNRNFRTTGKWIPDESQSGGHWEGPREQAVERIRSANRLKA